MTRASMSEIDANGLGKLLKKSGLLDDDRLVQEFMSQANPIAAGELSAEALGKWLVDKELITEWHLEKLLSGKYKGFFLGKYKLLGHLGSGGMSSVYLAEHRLSRQKRAIKVLPRKKVADKSYLDRFYQEAKVAASLNHPNVVKIYDVASEADTHYMVMEYVQGHDFHDLVKKRGVIDFRKAVEYCVCAAEGLQHAHAKGLVHRDIKPANLLLTLDGNVKVLDLGLALVNQEDDESLTLLYNERVMGTADYLSPEQAVNSHFVDLRSDIYSLGCTLYFMLTGHPPFPNGTLAQRIAMHQTKEPVDIRQSRPDCPFELVAICQQMMRKKPDQRYPNCEVLKTDLMGWLETGQQLGTGLLPGFIVSRLPDKNNTGNQADSNEPDSAQWDSKPIVIDTSGSSKSSKSAKSSQKNSGYNSRLSSKKRSFSDSQSMKAAPSQKIAGLLPKAPSKWLFPILVVAMFVILIIVVYFVSSLLPEVVPEQ